MIFYSIGSKHHYSDYGKKSKQIKNRERQIRSRFIIVCNNSNYFTGIGVFNCFLETFNTLLIASQTIGSITVR